MEKANEKVIQPGETVSSNGLEITLKEIYVAKDHKVEGEKENVHLVADFRIGNSGEKSVLISEPVQFELFDSEQEVGYIIGLDNKQRETEILPGQVLEKEITWELQEKSQPLSIVFNGDIGIKKVGEGELVNGPITVLTKLKGEKRIVFYIGDAFNYDKNT